MKAAADVIAHAVERHRPQRQHHHLARGRLAATNVFTQQEQQFARARKLRRITEPAPAGVEAFLELLKRRGKCVFVGNNPIGVAFGQRRQPLDHFARRLRHARAILAPGLGDLRQDIDKRRPAPLRGRREIGAAVKWLEVGRQPHAHRPPARTRRGLDECHVDAIDVRPFLAIDLDRDEVFVEHIRHADTFERLALHHMAPVTGRVANRQEDRLVGFFGGGKRRVAPRVPINGIVRMLQQIRTLLGS